MARLGKRTRVATGIYRDKGGFAVAATVRGVRREQRFPLTATAGELRAARKRLLETLDLETPEAAARGTLAAVVGAYLAALPEGRHKQDRAQVLQPWVEALGLRPFVTISRQEIIETMRGWHARSPITRNHRLSALRVLWRDVTKNPDRPHPCERIHREPAPKAHLNRARRMDLIQRVLEHVVDTFQDDRVSHAKAQLTLLAWTGQPASMLARIRPEHVRWRATPPEVYLQPRRKGAGVDAAWVPLVPQGAAALRAWLKLKAYDVPWHRGVLRTAWTKAITKTRTTLIVEAKGQRKAERARLTEDAAALVGMRVYDLRHSFLTAMGMLPGVDIHAVAEYARHANISTTLTYMRGASSEKMRAAVTALGAAVPRAGATNRPAHAAATQRTSAPHGTQRRTVKR